MAILCIKLNFVLFIVVLIVDLTDFPGSVWPNILDLIGSDKRVILVGNKVDLLPQGNYSCGFSYGNFKRIMFSLDVYNIFF